MAAKRYSWTQPCCNGCWGEKHGGKPTRLVTPVNEHCVYCNKTTWSGIYIRIDPKVAPYPTVEK